MRVRALGNTGLAVSEISFGTIPVLSGEVEILPHYYGRSMREALAIMERAYALGVNLYDTAVVPEYGDAEIKLGEFAQRHPDILISDKARAYSGEAMARAVETSLKNLRRERIEIYFVHQVAPENEEEAFGEGGALDELMRLKAHGIVLHAGIATHHYDVALRAAKDPRVDVLQVPGNVLERGILNRMKEEPAFEGKGVIVCKVFAAGILPDYFPAETLIAHALSYPISTAVLGLGSVGQVNRALRSGQQDEPPYPFAETMRRIRRFYEAIPCDRCQQCTCSMGIEIESLFRYYNYYHLGHRNWAKARLENLRERFADPCARCTNRTCRGACKNGIDIAQEVTRALSEFAEAPVKKEHGLVSGRDFIGVGVGAVILRDDRVLLLLRKKAPEADCWSIPGGKVEFGETTEEAVLREVKEELGVRGKVIAPLGVTNQILRGEGIHYVAPRYLVTIIGEPENMEPDKHADMRWFPVDRLPENITITTQMALSGLATWWMEQEDGR